MTEIRNPGAKSIRAWKKSERHGAVDWLVERFTSLALLPIFAWGVYAAYKLMNTSYEEKIAFLKAPSSVAMFGLMFITAIWHANLGLGTVIDDYFPKGGSRGLLIFLKILVVLALLIGGVGSLFFIEMRA